MVHQCLIRRTDQHQLTLGDERFPLKLSTCRNKIMVLELIITHISNCRYCRRDSLDPSLVKNKIVVCEDYVDPAENALLSGASGVVIESDFGDEDYYATTYPLPATYLSTKEGNDVLSYINSTK